MPRPPTDAGDHPPQTAAELTARLDALADPKHAKSLRWFFKTEPGGYGEGDVFAGVRMPQIRRACRDFRAMPANEIERMLAGEIHEHRLAGLVVLTEQAKRAAKAGDRELQRELCRFYLAHTDRINNWDLVDCSCRDVVGEWALTNGDLRPLRKLARSRSLWERRIAMISTAAFIRAGRTEVAFELAGLLVDDEHDLMHKAVGWMLREAGKRDAAGLDAFLERHAATMPRTALRYAIERMPPERRADWLGRRAAAGAGRPAD